MSEFLDNIKWQWEMQHSFPAEKWEELFQRLEEAEQLRTANAKLREEARWIPVSERLPENEEEVIVACVDETSITLWFGAYWMDDTHWKAEHEEYAAGYIDLITHWKPIVLPKKGE